MMDVILEGFDIANITNNGFYVVLILIGFDIITGLLVGAKERKINSSINFEGMIRKFSLIVALFFVTFIDSYFQTKGQLTLMAIGMIVIYEGISVIENFKMVGVDLNFLTKYFDQDKVGKGVDENDK